MDVIQVSDSVFLENIVFEDSNSDLIANNTYNTWQKDRNLREKIRDTKQGKVSESLIKFYIESKMNLSYIEYDELRTDHYRKHAPFDGIIFNKDKISNEILRKCIDHINNDVINSTNGTITPDCRKLLNNNNIYTVEIKSTQINDRKKDIAKKLNLHIKDRRECLLKAIKDNDDFLTYLHFCRYGNFSNFYDYCNYVKDKYTDFYFLSGNSLIEKIKQIELNNLSDVHIRLYIDYVIKRAIIIGFICKESFLENPILIKKMIKYGKSEGAVYLTKPLKLAISINELENIVLH